MKSVKVVKVYKYSVFFKDPNGHWKEATKGPQARKEIAESMASALRLQGKEAEVHPVFSHNQRAPRKYPPFKGFQVRVRSGFPKRWRNHGKPLKNLHKAKAEMLKLVIKGFESEVRGTGPQYQKVWS